MQQRIADHEITAFWAICRLNSNENLSIALGRRKKAAVYFTSESLASNFQKADFAESKWRVVQMPAESFAEWLRQRTKTGTHFIYRDPSNLFCLGKPLRVLEVLREIENRGSGDASGQTANGRHAPKQPARAKRTVAEGV
jgi:hypothetical protein